MPTKKDAAWWKNYRARKAELDKGDITEGQAAQALGVDRLTLRSAEFEQDLGSFLVDRLDGRGVEALLEGIRKGNPDAWRKYVKEAPVDDIAKKAIEPEAVKVQPDGKLSKGLGQVPGLPPPTPMPNPTIQHVEYRPAPKPGEEQVIAAPDKPEEERHPIRMLVLEEVIRLAIAYLEEGRIDEARDILAATVEGGMVE